MRMSLGNRIRILRRGLSYSQKELAALMGVSPQAVSKWENDLAYPDIMSLYSLAQILRVTTDTLLAPDFYCPGWCGQTMREVCAAM